MNLLLTGARAPTTLYLARLLGAKHRVFIAESCSEHLCQTSRYVTANLKLPAPRFDPKGYFDQLERQMFSNQIDLCIPMCEEVMFVAAGADHSFLKRRFLVDSLSVLKTLHNKWSFYQFCTEMGLLVPETHLLENQSDWETLSANEPWFIRPVFSRFAARSGVWKPGDFSRVGEPWVASSVLIGEGCCSYSIARKGRVVAHSAYRPTYRAGMGAGVFFEPLSSGEILEIAQHVVKHLNFTGQIAFDFIETPKGLYTIECNPRATSGLFLVPRKSLEAALLDPDCEGQKPLLQKGRPMMLTLPTLLYGKGMPIMTRLRDLFRARDALWDLSDPFPYADQLRILHSLHQNARRLGLTSLQASTFDIEWDGSHG
ncbi:MAG: hypothetical protein U0Z75_02705 [Deinococcaceae bacterium]